MDDLPRDADVQLLMAQLKAAERPAPKWLWPVVITVALDVAGIVALWFGYSASGEREGALAIRVLLIALFSQPGAFGIAKRSRQPWILPAWALLFFISAVFTAVFGYASGETVGV